MFFLANRSESHFVSAVLDLIVAVGAGAVNVTQCFQPCRTVAVSAHVLADICCVCVCSSSFCGIVSMGALVYQEIRVIDFADARTPTKCFLEPLTESVSSKNKFSL